MGFIFSLLVFFILIILELCLDFNRFAFAPGNLNIYLSIKNFFFILLPTTIFLFYSGPEKRSNSVNSLKLLLRRMDGVSENETKRAMSVFRAGGNFMLFLSGIFMILTIIILLQNLSDPNIIGPRMAEAMIPLFYGIIGKMVFFASEQRLNLLYLKQSL
ncbi:hypothetical protein KKA14_06100 [bacterium]|nr:hypothetical protein [bacterium]